MSSHKSILRRYLIDLSRPLTFVFVILSVWYLVVEIPLLIYSLYLPGSGARKVNIIAMAIFYFIPAIRISFVAAVGVRIILSSKVYLKELQREILPPYSPHPQSSTSLPVSQDIVHLRHKKSWYNAKRWFQISLITMLATGVAYWKYIMWNPEIVLSRLPNSIPEPIIIVASYLLSVPPQPFVDTYVGTMNSETLVATLLLVWIPVAPLFIGFINLNSFLYNKAVVLVTEFVAHVSSPLDS